MELWIWAVILMAVGMALGVMEVFIPSAGILSFLSAAAILVSIIMGFRQSTTVGLILLFITVAGMPTLIVLAFKYWPHTAIGRRVLLMAPSQKDVLPEDSKKEFLKSLVGKVGKAKSKMLPSGVITIDGRTVNATSEGAPIEIGQAVRVVQVRGKRVMVRLTDEKDTPSSREDLLSRPIESILEDPFEERTA